MKVIAFRKLIVFALTLGALILGTTTYAAIKNPIAKADIKQTESNINAPVQKFTDESTTANKVLEWNQIFIDTLISTNTPNSSSQRLGAIVHTAIFDAYNGIEHRYTPIFYQAEAPRGASRRAAVIAAGYTALVGLFPSRQPALHASYLASLEDLSHYENDDQSLHRRHRLGNRGCASGARLARNRRFQWKLSFVHGRFGSRSMATDSTGNRDECPGIGVHVNVRSG